jgi:lactate dehydrogenase-like 2-hydroxyacid dehydrogenase
MNLVASGNISMSACRALPQQLTVCWPETAVASMVVAEMMVLKRILNNWKAKDKKGTWGGWSTGAYDHC